MYTTTRMALDGYLSAAREIAQYAKRSATRRGKKYHSSGWKYYLGDYRGSHYSKLLAHTGYTHYDTQAWGSLKKCWKGFIIANSKGDEEKMRYYAKGRMKFQKQLGLEVRIFPDLGLWDGTQDTIDLDLESRNITNARFSYD